MDGLTDLRTYERTDVRTYGRTCIQAYRCTHVQTYIPTDVHTYTYTQVHTYWCTDVHAHRPTFRQARGQERMTDSQTDRQTARQTDGQTDEINIHYVTQIALECVISKSRTWFHYSSRYLAMIVDEKRVRRQDFCHAVSYLAINQFAQPTVSQWMNDHYEGLVKK